MTIGAWILPAIVTALAAYWMLKDEHYRGDYNFSALFVIPTGCSAIFFAWMLYFGIGWASQ